MQRIPVAGPWITQKEVDYVADAAKNAWYSQANSYNRRFELAFAEYIGVKHATSLPSCTSAIHLALAVLGVGPGDEVIVPDVTWIASAAPISYVGAKPVFADIEPETWCISERSLRSRITEKTKAVIAVDLYGGTPDLTKLEETARERGVALIEDAAEALGSERAGRKAGGFGDFGVFSFHGSKTLTTGEGGMLVTNHSDLFERVLFLRDHGRPPGDRMFCNTEVAYKYKMSGLQAALGLAQLERVDELVGKKRLIFSWYQQRLQDLRGVALNSEPANTINSYWMITAVVDQSLGLTKEALMDEFIKRNIDTRPFFHPLSSIAAYKDSPAARAARSQNRVSYALSPYGINLPSGLNLTEDLVDRVCAAFGEILAAARKG